VFGVFRFLLPAPTSSRILGIPPARLAQFPDASGTYIFEHVPPVAKRSVLEWVLQKMLLPRTSWRRQLKLKSVCSCPVKIDLLRLREKATEAVALQFGGKRSRVAIR
jgi:hypothetical protein